MLVVDDRSCVDILQDGDIDAVVRKAIRRGLSLVRAVQMVTINPAEYFRLEGLGAVAPGYRANLVVIDDLASFKIGMVFWDGALVARDGKALFEVEKTRAGSLGNTVKMKPLAVEALRFPARLTGGQHAVPLHVIEIVPGQIVTKKTVETMPVVDRQVLPDISRDILKLVVVERHRATGNVGVGLVRGLGLKEGALASTVAHDSHNVIAAGTDDTSILTAIKEVERLQGGLVAVIGDRVLASLALPVAGLMSDQPLEDAVDALKEVEEAAAKLGCGLSSPFSTLSFLALPVIPELRLTDLGLVDVNEFRLIE
jgi:adenine deaminase